jgi:hypothetical protein
MRMSESNMGSLLVLTIQPLEEGLIVEVNIDRIPQRRSSNGAVQLDQKRMARVRIA